MTDRNRPRQVWQSILLVALVCGFSLPAALERPARAEPPPSAGDRPAPAPSPDDPPLTSLLREPSDNGEIWIDANGTLSNSRETGSLRLPERSLLQPSAREPWNRSQPLGSAASASQPGVTEAVGLEPPTHLAAAGPTSAVVLPPLASPPPPNTLDTMPVESAATLRASASMAIDPLTPPSVATPQTSPLSLPAPLSPNVGPFEVVDNSNELVVVLGRSKHLRTKVDVEGAEAADRSVCDVQLTTARDLTIAGRNPGVTRVVVRLEGDSPRPAVLLVRVVPDVTWQGASPRPADAAARDPSVVQSPPPPAPPPEQFGLRVIVAELDRTVAKTAGIDTDSTSSPATMLLQSLPRAGGNAAVLKNRLTVCLGTRGLQEHGALRFFSEPTLVVTSGRPAKVLVHNELPAPPMPSSGGSHPHANDIPARPTTLNLVATLLTKDRIRLELTAEVRPQEPDTGLAPMGPSGPRAASAELGNGQTVVVCGLIDAPRKPPQESPEKFPIFSQFFTKPPPPPPHLTEMLILITVEHLDPANAMSLGSPSAASSNANQK